MKAKTMAERLLEIVEGYGNIDVVVMVNGAVIASPNIIYKDSECDECIIECND